MRQIAYKNEEHSGYARALLALLNEEIILPDDDLGEAPPEEFISNGNITETISTPSKQLKIYPNPANTSVEVIIPKDILSGELVIYNTNGQLILTQNLETINQSVSISTQDFHNGIYFIGIQQSGKIKYFERLIINH